MPKVLDSFVAEVMPRSAGHADGGSGKKLVAAVAAALTAGAIGGGIGIANADPTPPPPPTTVVDTPEPGDTPDEAADTDDVQDGDQSGPEVPDTPLPSPPGR
jgi:hypothetical protein